MGRADELKAELEVVELEDELRDLKADPDVPTGERGGPPASEEYLQLKEQLREARRRFREMREAAPPEQAPGDATVRPATVRSKTSVKRPGGER